MNHTTKDIFSLQEIANWQLDLENAQVELPAIQRGFVWKTSQIENLWDSLLRNYPIGAFLFSEAGNKYHLLDGQQRSTSIFLGFYNPYLHNDAKPWAIKGELPVVWIDLKPKDINLDTRKFLIRVTTQSHPWGYEASNNSSILSVGDRRKALSIFRKHPENKDQGYTHFKNTTTFPYDASYPLPLSFLLEADSVEEVLKSVEKYLPDYFSTKEELFQNKQEFTAQLKNEIYTDLESIFQKVKKLDTFRVKSDIIAKEVLDEEAQQDTPTLFVRINSAGTSLSTDDLIYSIYKATFPETKKLVEEIGLDFIAPTQVVSIVSRIAFANISERKYPQKMSVKDFQRRINAKDSEFKDELQRLIESGTIKDLFKVAISILSAKDNPLFEGEIPPVIVKQFIQKQQDLFLFLVYWMQEHSAKYSDQRKLNMLSKLLVFSWFSFSNIRELWNQKMEDEAFWEQPLNELFWWNKTDGIHFLIPPSLLRQYYAQKEVEQRFIQGDEHQWELYQEGIGRDILNYYEGTKAKKIEDEKIEDEKANEYFEAFIHEIRGNKQMILFAQRNYINSEFKDYNQLENLEDTNVPWDWDHIYPQSWVYNMKYCRQSIRDWAWANGNFRAISLEQNRSEGNHLSPKERLEKNHDRELSFVSEDDYDRYWSKIDNRIYEDEEQLSFHFRAITTRMLNIYEKVWEDLKIEKFIQ